MVAPSIESTTVTPRSRPKGQAVPAPMGLPTSLPQRKRPGMDQQFRMIFLSFPFVGYNAVLYSELCLEISDK